MMSFGGIASSGVVADALYTVRNEAAHVAKAIRETLAAVDPKIKPETFLQRVEEESSILLERDGDRPRSGVRSHVTC
jgi:hypothetical protein